MNEDLFGYSDGFPVALVWCFESESMKSIWQKAAFIIHW